MNDNLTTVVQAFQVMAEGYRLLAARLGREFDQLQSAHAELKEYSQRLEANAQQLAFTHPTPLCIGVRPDRTGERIGIREGSAG